MPRVFPCGVGVCSLGAEARPVSKGSPRVAAVGAIADRGRQGGDLQHGHATFPSRSWRVAAVVKKGSEGLSTGIGAHRGCELARAGSCHFRGQQGPAPVLEPAAAAHAGFPAPEGEGASWGAGRAGGRKRGCRLAGIGRLGQGCEPL